MKRYVRYQSSVVPKKLRVEVRITVDDRGVEYTSEFDGNVSTNISFFPIVTLTIQRQGEIDDNGNKTKAPWNPNDSLGMSRFNMPLLVNALKRISKNMERKELYTYQGSRLELNEKLAEDIRDVFMIGNITVELSAVVIIQPDDSRIEGIKMKFNNEQSSVLLTLNELEILTYNLDHMDVDSIALLIYLNYIKRPDHPKLMEDKDIKPQNNINVDILPKAEFKEFDG